MQLTIIFIAIIVASLVNVSTCNFAEGGDMRNVVLEQMNDELYGEESGYNVGFVTPSDLENDEKKRMEHQPDSNNTYQRWRWDIKFCPASGVQTPIFGRALMANLVYDPTIVDMVCYKAVQIGLRMLGVLASEFTGTFFWPWTNHMKEFRLEGLGEDTLELSEITFGEDHKIHAVFAHIDPKTLVVMKIDFTNDFQKVWDNRNLEVSIPVTIIADFGVINGLTSEEFSPSPWPESVVTQMKALTSDLMYLFGQPNEVVEGWMRVDDDGQEAIFPIGVEVILHTLYSTFVVLKEDMAGEDGKPELPKHNDESFDQFRSDIHEFVSGLGYGEANLNDASDFIMQYLHEEMGEDALTESLAEDFEKYLGAMMREEMGDEAYEKVVAEEIAKFLGEDEL